MPGDKGVIGLTILLQLSFFKYDFMKVLVFLIENALQDTYLAKQQIRETKS